MVTATHYALEGFKEIPKQRQARNTQGGGTAARVLWLYLADNGSWLVVDCVTGGGGLQWNTYSMVCECMMWCSYMYSCILYPTMSPLQKRSKLKQSTHTHTHTHTPDPHIRTLTRPMVS